MEESTKKIKEQLAWIEELAKKIKEQLAWLVESEALAKEVNESGRNGAEPKDTKDSQG